MEVVLNVCLHYSQALALFPAKIRRGINRAERCLIFVNQLRLVEQSMLVVLVEQVNFVRVDSQLYGVAGTCGTSGRYTSSQRNALTCDVKERFSTEHFGNFYISLSN